MDTVLGDSSQVKGLGSENSDPVLDSSSQSTPKFPPATINEATQEHAGQEQAGQEQASQEQPVEDKALQDKPTPKKDRKIIHCDADCFYAAVEIRDNPSLAGKAVAVGGSSDRRGVISTCNYEARRFGVRSAMSSAHAQRLCPDLILVPGNMDKYREVSQQMREIFHEYTDLVEPLSLDEAYLDVTHCTAHKGSATLIAEEIRQKIHKVTRITVSAGVSNSKFIAKIASDWNKPDGLCVIAPAYVEDFVRRLPVKKIHGVGKVTSEKLDRLGIQTCDDVRNYGLAELVARFGVFGSRLYELSHGNDTREVKPHRIRKSLSVEHTYSSDLTSSAACLDRLPDLMLELRSRMNNLSDDYKVSKAFVKVKFSDFSTTTIERVGTSARVADYRDLMIEGMARTDLPVRLLGIGVRFWDVSHENSPIQLPLFES